MSTPNSAARAASLQFRVRLALRRRLRKVVVRNAIRGGTAALRLNPRFRPSRYGIRVEQNLRYRPGRSRAHTLDVFRPERPSGPLPVLFYVHGGGFSMLSKDTHFGMALTFAREGFLVYNINYRLAPKHPFPAAIEDVCAAFEWAIRSAPGYGGDLHRLVLSGESAGGNLVSALSVATNFERPEPYARRVFELGVVPQAVVPACGILQVSDVDRFARRKQELPGWIRMMLDDVSSGYLGTLGAQPTADTTLADPLLVYEGHDEPARPLPRFFLPVGTRDPLIDDTRRMARALARRNVEHRAIYYPGEIHAFHALVWREQARACWADKFDFLGDVLAAAEADSAA